MLGQIIVSETLPQTGYRLVRHPCYGSGIKRANDSLDDFTIRRAKRRGQNNHRADRKEETPTVMKLFQRLCKSFP
jgi:hypothetical protein